MIYKAPKSQKESGRKESKECSIAPHQRNSKFSFRQHFRLNRLIRMDIAFARFDSARLLSLGYPARTCLWRKAWTVCEPQRSSECYRRHGMMSASDSQNQKSHAAVKKVFSSNGKAKWNYSAHFLLIGWPMIRPTVMFWCSLCTSGNANDEPLAKFATWCVTVFCLYLG